MTENQQYIISSLDLLNEDLTDFLYSGARITGFRLVEDDNAELVSLLQDWKHLTVQTSGDRGMRNMAEPPTKLRVSMRVITYYLTYLNQPYAVLQTASALVYDAVKLLATAIEALDKSQKIVIPKLSCENEVPWSIGTSLVNYMRPTIFRGISGLLTFNEFGHRTLFTLDVYSLTWVSYPREDSIELIVNHR